MAIELYKDIGELLPIAAFEHVAVNPLNDIFRKSTGVSRDYPDTVNKGFPHHQAETLTRE